MSAQPKYTVEIDESNTAELEAIKKRCGDARRWSEFVDYLTNVAIGSVLGSPELVDRLWLEHVGINEDKIQEILDQRKS